jgi:hypothetical protein
MFDRLWLLCWGHLGGWQRCCCVQVLLLLLLLLLWWLRLSCVDIVALLLQYYAAIGAQKGTTAGFAQQDL